MENKTGFSEQENEIMDKLIEAHNLYMQLETTHPNHVSQWIISMHALQNLLSMRILQRDYPDIFITIKPEK